MNFAFGVPDPYNFPPTEWRVERVPRVQQFVIRYLNFFEAVGIQLVLALDGPGEASLQSLVRTLSVNPSIARPIRAVFIASHGSDAGWLQIPLDAVGRP